MFFPPCTACNLSRQFIKTSQKLIGNKYINNLYSILTNKIIQTVIGKIKLHNCTIKVAFVITQCIAKKHTEILLETLKPLSSH